MMQTTDLATELERAGYRVEAGHAQSGPGFLNLFGDNPSSPDATVWLPTWPAYEFVWGGAFEHRVSAGDVSAEELAEQIVDTLV